MQGRADMRAAIRRTAGEGDPSRLRSLLFEQTDLASQVERLTAAVDEIRDELEQRGGLLDRLATHDASPDETPRATRYWLFIPSPAGYALAELDSDRTLTRGSEVAAGGDVFHVSVIARSPFLDGRPCAYLEPRPPTNA